MITLAVLNTPASHAGYSRVDERGPLDRDFGDESFVERKKYKAAPPFLGLEETGWVRTSNYLSDNSLKIPLSITRLRLRCLSARRREHTYYKFIHH